MAERVNRTNCIGITTLVNSLRLVVGMWVQIEDILCYRSALVHGLNNEFDLHPLGREPKYDVVSHKAMNITEFERSPR